MKFVSLFFYHSVVKEEIVDDDAHLPCFNGRVVSWVTNNKFYRYKFLFLSILSFLLLRHIHTYIHVLHERISMFFTITCSLFVLFLIKVVCHI